MKPEMVFQICSTITPIGWLLLIVAMIRGIHTKKLIHDNF